MIFNIKAKKRKAENAGGLVSGNKEKVNDEIQIVFRRQRPQLIY